jgi:hypothetical protein
MTDDLDVWPGGSESASDALRSAPRMIASSAFEEAVMARVRAAASGRPGALWGVRGWPAQALAGAALATALASLIAVGHASGSVGASRPRSAAAQGSRGAPLQQWGEARWDERTKLVFSLPWYPLWQSWRPGSCDGC